MKIKTSFAQGNVPVVILQVEGDIDSASYESFYQNVEKNIVDGARYILIDLTNTPFVSSAGLRSLLRIVNELRAIQPDLKFSETEITKKIAAGQYKSPHLKLLNLSRETQTAFELSGFNLFIETFTDLDTALAAF